MRVICITLLLLPSACQPGPEGMPGPPGPQGPMGAMGAPGAGGSGAGFVEGQRLKQRYWTGEDGARIPSGIADSKFNVPCTGAIATDGAVRCLPAGANLQKVFRLPDCSDSFTTLAPVGTATLLTSPFGVWRLSSPRTPPTSYYFTLAGDAQCRFAPTGPSPTEYQQYTVDVVPPLEFVKLTPPSP